MADRASGGGIPGVPKQVFELDKDERWQARLEDARARREIALREKAGGKPQKARPKPWEVEGAAYDAPKPIEPVIQDRGDEKIDFADRLETIREAARTENAAPSVGKTPGLGRDRSLRWSSREPRMLRNWHRAMPPPWMPAARGKVLRIMPLSVPRPTASRCRRRVPRRR